MRARGDQGGPPLVLGGQALEYVTDWERGVGMTPADLERKLRKSGYGHLLPQKGSGHFQSMIRGEHSWPRELLRVVLEELGTSLEAFLGLSRRPFSADDLVAKVNAVSAHPSDHGRPTSDAIDGLFHVMRLMLADVEASLLRNEQAASAALLAVADELRGLWPQMWSAANTAKGPDAIDQYLEQTGRLLVEVAKLEPSLRDGFAGELYALTSYGKAICADIEAELDRTDQEIVREALVALQDSHFARWHMSWISAVKKAAAGRQQTIVDSLRVGSPRDFAPLTAGDIPLEIAAIASYLTTILADVHAAVRLEPEIALSALRYVHRSHISHWKGALQVEVCQALLAARGTPLTSRLRRR
jgi:hypothetical protein